MLGEYLLEVNSKKTIEKSKDAVPVLGIYPIGLFCLYFSNNQTNATCSNSTEQNENASLIHYCASVIKLL